MIHETTDGNQYRNQYPHAEQDTGCCQQQAGKGKELLRLCTEECCSSKRNSEGRDYQVDEEARFLKPVAGGLLVEKPPDCQDKAYAS